MALFKKRAGTSGISGHLYETKLIAYILFRLSHDDRVERFSLGSNMEKVGAFDDICFNMRIKGRDRPVAVFIQVKHKESDGKLPTFDNKSVSVKWFESLAKIKKKIASSKNRDQLFSGDITDSDYIFVLYTNATCDSDADTAYVSEYADLLNDLIGTSSTVGTVPSYTDQQVEDFGQIILNEDITLLAKYFASSLSANRSMNLLNNEYVQQYHLFLKQKVVDVTERVDVDALNPDEETRTLTFRRDFFENDDKYVKLFRDQLFREILKNNPKLREHSKIQGIPSQDASTRQPSVDELLSQLKLKVPIAFGNVDLTIRGGPEKIKKRVKYLMEEVVKMCERKTQKGPNKIVKIDDTIDDGVLGLSGGLAGAVGNLLVYDEDTNMLKFSSKFRPEQNNAKALFQELVTKIDKLEEYRFDIRTVKFPKLNLDCTSVVREFLEKFVIFHKQKNHLDVENILKKAIQDRLRTNPQIFPNKTDLVFLHYHNEIQTWWMSPKTSTYLTKTDILDEQAVYNIVTEPQISALHNRFHKNNVRFYGYCFNEDAIDWIKLPINRSKMVVVTNSVTLTCLKVIQYLKKHFSVKKYAVLDLACVVKLPIADVNSLNAELTITEQVIIIVWRNTPTLDESDEFLRLRDIAQSMKQKHLIFITNSKNIETLQLYFVCSELNDETQTLTALTVESQKVIIKEAKVLFQGEEVGLDLLVDDESVGFIKGDVLDKVVNNELISIGTSLSDSNYEDMKHLYLDRRVTLIDEDPNNAHGDSNLVKTFHDVTDDAVLIIAMPGMGKSTLLTHLSCEAKKLNEPYWVVRINLKTYSKQFDKWQTNKKVVDTLETLRFLCQAVSNINSDISIDFADNQVHLVSCEGDERTRFELNLFLHFYKKGKLILLFDGFDEICPDYEDAAIHLLKVVRNDPHKNKMWVTSKPCSGFNTLRTLFGKYYRLEHLNFTEQQSFIERLFNNHKDFTMLSSISDFSFALHAESKKTLEEMYKCCALKKYCLNESSYDKLTDLEKTKMNSDIEIGLGTPSVLNKQADYMTIYTAGMLNEQGHIRGCVIL